jgi:hypothetical protein
MGGYRIDQVFLGKWFGQIFFRAHDAPPGAIEDAVLARQHDYRSRLEILVVLDQRAGLVTIQARHHDIDENYVRLVLGNFGQRLEAVDRGNYFATHFFEQGFCAAADGFTVVDNHHLDVQIDRLLFAVRHLRFGVHATPMDQSGISPLYKATIIEIISSKTSDLIKLYDVVSICRGQISPDDYRNAATSKK